MGRRQWLLLCGLCCAARAFVRAPTARRLPSLSQFCSESGAAEAATREWRRTCTREGKPYWWNVRTRETRWDVPPDQPLATWHNLLGRLDHRHDEQDNTKPAEQIALPTSENSPRLLAIRHTSAHVMAMAVQKVFPGTQGTIGPEWTTDENDFYCDFHRSDDFKLTEVDLKTVQEEIDRIIEKKLPISFSRVSREEAQLLLESADELFKLRMLNSLDDATFAVCRIGDEWSNPCFCWACRGAGARSATHAVKRGRMSRISSSSFGLAVKHNQIIKRTCSSSSSTP